jgi:RNA polymerase sigma-70 factor, ECF subfamily
VAHSRTPVDWVSIGDLYQELAIVTGSPVVELNRAVAIAESGGLEEALQLVDSLHLDAYRFWHSARADFLRRLGRRREASEAYETALSLTTSENDRRFLQSRIAECFE